MNLSLRDLPRIIRRWLLPFLGLLAMQPSFAYGQEFRATVTGHVTDPQDVPVPGATVTVTNTKTNLSINTV